MRVDFVCLCGSALVVVLCLCVSAWLRLRCVRAQVALDVASGMKHLHHERSPAIVHRDLKTANLLVRRGVVRCKSKKKAVL